MASGLPPRSMARLVMPRAATAGAELAAVRVTDGPLDKERLGGVR
jgi:hypothetical protein